MTYLGSLVAVVFLSLMAISVPGSAAPALIGTLTCTAEAGVAGNDKELAGSKLRCAFQPAGQKANQEYTGGVSGLEDMVQKSGKALLIWTVLAAEPATDAINLVGVYTPADDAALPANSLVGGRDKTVVLQPAVQNGGGAAPLPKIKGLQLELPKV